MNMHINIKNEYGTQGAFLRDSRTLTRKYSLRGLRRTERAFVAAGRNFVCGQGHRGVSRNSTGAGSNLLKSASSTNNIQNALLGPI